MSLFTAWLPIDESTEESHEGQGRAWARTALIAMRITSAIAGHWRGLRERLSAWHHQRREPDGTMCGRFTQVFTWAEIQEFYSLLNELAPNLRACWNVAPTQEIGVIGAREGGGLGFTRMRWGLVPSWAKDLSIGARMINARSDTIREKPAFREAFAKRRCVIPVSGFFEWKGSGAGKTPHYITSAQGEPLSFAGLWERWRNAEGEWVRTATIITTDANDALKHLHHRMPVILARADVDRWLVDGNASLMRPAPNDWVTSWPVSTRVNAVKNDTPDLIEAAAAMENRDLLD